MKQKFFTAITLAAIGLLAPSAKADTLVVTGIGYGIQGVPIVADPGAWAVQINITLNGVVHTAYCIDLFTNIGFSTYNSVPSSPGTLLPNGPRLAWIFSTYAPLVAGAADPNLAAAALQLALWDVRHDDGLGFSEGSIQLDNPPNDLLAAAQAILDASVGMSSYSATILYNQTQGIPPQPAQTLITDGSWPIPPSAIPGVPEPSTFAMLGAGTVLIFLAKRRR